MNASIVCTVIFAATLVSFSHEDDTFAAALAVYRTITYRSMPECVKESNVNPELIEKSLDHGDFAEDREFKCFLKCLLRHAKVFDEQDEVAEQYFKENVGVKDENLINHLFQKCAVMKGTDSCDTAWRICKCVYQSAQAALKKE